MRKFISRTRAFVTSDLTRNFGAGFAVGAVALVGLATRADAAAGLLF